MKNNKNNHHITFFVGLNLTSCDFLEKDPTYTTPENFFKNEADATSWLTGTYAILGQSSFYGNEFLYLVGGDDLGHYGGANRGPNKSGLICNNANTSDPAVAALWYTLYSGINRANIFLENIDAVPDMNDDTRKQYKAEARFLRAFYYFTLVECWGDVPFQRLLLQKMPITSPFHVRTNRRFTTLSSKRCMVLPRISNLLKI